MGFYNVADGWSYYTPPGNENPFLVDGGLTRLICKDSLNNLYFAYDWDYNISSPYKYISRLKISTDNGLTWGAYEEFGHTNKTMVYGMAIDNSDNIFALYFDVVSKYNFVRKRDSGGSWSSAVQVGNYNDWGVAIAIDSNNYIYVYVIDTGGNVYKSTNGGISFSGTSVLPGLDEGGDICIDSNDDVHVTAQGYYIKCTGGVWGSVEDIGTGWIADSKICVDSLNIPHVTGDYGNSCIIWYANKISGSWSAQKLYELWITGDDWAIFPNITIDSNDIIYVSYCGGPNQETIVLETSLDRGFNFTSSVIWSGNVGGHFDEVWYPTMMFATWPKSGGVSTNIRTNGYYLGMWYEDFDTWWEYIKFGSGIVEVDEDYAFVT